MVAGAVAPVLRDARTKSQHLLKTFDLPRHSHGAGDFLFRTAGVVTSLTTYLNPDYNAVVTPRLLLTAYILQVLFSGALVSQSPSESASRHARVAQRRAGPAIICHRGSSELAHENTLEAYRATFELGADGNEIDIRRTRDGVLVCFHDDTIEAQLPAYGDISDYSYSQLQGLSFRDPGPFGRAARIPKLTEVLDLHRRYGGLIHLDIKQSGIDVELSALLDRLDMWDHIAHCNAPNAQAILTNPKYHGRTYKGALYEDHSDVDLDAIKAMLQKTGDDVIVDDPRGVILALGRTIGRVSTAPVTPSAAAPVATRHGDVRQLVAVLEDRDPSPISPAARITERARAAEQLLSDGADTTEVLAALQYRARHRSLSKDWRYQALDGAAALRDLILLHAPVAVQIARDELWLDDPALDAVYDPAFGVPRAWSDFRMKEVVFRSIAQRPTPQAERLCRDYLALTAEEARKLGPPQFDAAARALLAISPRVDTAEEMMHHSMRIVRGRAILECLKHANETWALEALKRSAPYALRYLPPE